MARRCCFKSPLVHYLDIAVDVVQSTQYFKILHIYKYAFKVCLPIKQKSKASAAPKH